MKRFLALGALGAIVPLSFAVLATADDGKHGLRSGGDDPVTIAVYGDAPYSTVQTDYSVSPPTNSDHTQIDGTPGFVDAVNADKKVKLVMFAGDIHSGKEPCTFAYDRSIYDF